MVADRRPLASPLPPASKSRNPAFKTGKERQTTKKQEATLALSWS